MTTFESMIDIVEYEGKKLINSLELYKTAGYLPKHYTRWIKTHFPDNAHLNIDYFDFSAPCLFPRNTNHRRELKWITSVKCKIYFLTIDMAITMCLIAKTEKAKKLKLFLQLHK